MSPDSESPAPKRATGVQSVGKAIDVLEILTTSPTGELSLSDITAATGQPMPTVHRLVRTLLDRGFLRQLPNRRYALGTELIVLGQAARSSFGSWSTPVLHELVGEFGETVNLAVLDGDDVVYIGQSPSPHAVRMFTEIGRRIKPHATGVGKALLGRLPDDQVLALLRRTGMPARTPHTITTPEAFLDKVREARKQGHALDNEEMELGVRCVAVSLPEARLNLALSMSGPATRMTNALIGRALPRLHEAADQLAADFSAG
ncbi:IclR family transcriptional regulator [Serinicoccus marinus]|uniref:IclR family transcriptional regulator n=1 Tax=Serinicoccus marinus TaxID=247333 RepID=UPI0004854D32|nr:IclR family transcriptional regulator [Serinicoccus marinus]